MSFTVRGLTLMAVQKSRSPGSPGANGAEHGGTVRASWATSRSSGRIEDSRPAPVHGEVTHLAPMDGDL